mmetsp:Transcript_91947/g.265271  ORF Transcript_91947/g.265271 Transcript_91947/m.265271 type:complete len:319 (-) Transcript_91947:60-1016(-)
MAVLARLLPAPHRVPEPLAHAPPLLGVQLEDGMLRGLPSGEQQFAEHLEGHLREVFQAVLSADPLLEMVVALGIPLAPCVDPMPCGVPTRPPQLGGERVRDHLLGHAGFLDRAQGCGDEGVGPGGVAASGGDLHQCQCNALDLPLVHMPRLRQPEQEHEHEPRIPWPTGYGVGRWIRQRLARNRQRNLRASRWRCDLGKPRRPAPLLLPLHAAHGRAQALEEAHGALGLPMSINSLVLQLRDGGEHLPEHVPRLRGRGRGQRPLRRLIPDAALLEHRRGVHGGWPAIGPQDALRAPAIAAVGGGQLPDDWKTLVGDHL